MQASPIQTRAILYRRVNVSPHLTDKGEIDTNLHGPDFQWEGVKLQVKTGTAVEATSEVDPTGFLVSLNVQISNKDGKTCPYVIDIELLGILSVSPKLAPARREDLATVNGLAIVYSATRELITNLTSRMEYGPLVLPGVNFADHASIPERQVAAISDSEIKQQIPTQKDET